MPFPTTFKAIVPVDIMSVIYFINILFKIAILRTPRLPGSYFVFVKLLILGNGFVSDGNHRLKSYQITKLKYVFKEIVNKKNSLL